MASQNNIHISDELHTAMQRVAEMQGKTLDEVFEAAAKRYLAHEGLRELERYGRERARRMALNVPESEVEGFVQRIIEESRRENRER